MRERKTHILVAVLLVALVGMMAFAIGCGSSDTTGGSAISGSAMERATTILGHAPTGLAKQIVDKGTVIVANDSDYAPQSSVDPVTKKIVGFDVDAAKGMAEILGLRIEWKHPIWETIPAGLQVGLYDVSIGSMAITPERQQNLGFSDPYYYASSQVFVKKGGPQITGVADLAGKTVGVNSGTTYYDYLKKNSKAIVKGYSTEAASLQDLLNGNLDFAMTAGTTGQELVVAGKPIEASGKPLYYEDCAMAVKKGETDWVSLLDYAVQKMHADGQLTAMSKQWYNGLDLSVKQ